ncbi:MAG: YDG domain-containing protein, partial [Tannerella sp.]|nr:YDG domain-containing protein [Tannerella sp.]
MNRFFTKTIRQKRNNIFRYCTFAVLLITAYVFNTATAVAQTTTVSFTGATIKEKAYDGNKNAEVLTLSYSLSSGESGTLTADQLSSHITYTAEYNSSTPSANRTVTITVTALAGDWGSYTLGSSSTVTVPNQTITKKVITISGGTVTSKTY